jgi:hypothetical protein
MSSKLSKASTLAAIITLVMAFTISISAQTPDAVNSLTAKTHSMPETKGSDLEKKSVPAAEGAEPTAVPAHAGTPLAGMADEGREANSKAGSASPQTTPTDGWQFQLTPYLWIASISGRAGIGNLITDTSTSVTDSNVELNFGFMGTFEARKNKFIILTDLQYSDLATEKGNPGPLFSSTRASFKTFILDPEVGYRLLDNEKGAFVDVLGGLRYWHLNGHIAFRPGILAAAEASRSRSWVDGVVGLRGRAALSQRWFVTGKADLGGGGSKFTYQLFGGVGVMVHKKVALIGGYRDLNVNYDKDGFLFDMSLHGPVFGVGFKF